MSTVVLFGTLDTKGAEYAFVRAELIALGCDVVLVDTGVLGDPLVAPDIGRNEVAAAGPSDLNQLVQAGDRGEAVSAMAAGAAVVARRLLDEGRLDAVLGLGGSGGASIMAEIAAALPIGVPKVVVSTIASGETAPYVRGTDVTLMYPIVDIAGLNRISRPILRNAAAAVAGMAAAADRLKPGRADRRRSDEAALSSATPERPLIAATMFGVTTPGVDALRSRLEELGYEVLVFHATGTGGASMEALIRSGHIDAVADMTTTELADELAGGVCSAGATRLTAAAECGIPQVVSAGALDMVNFGPRTTVPDRYRDRTLYAHNENVTLMRTSAEECAELGRRVATRLSAATAPTAIFLPRRGLSMLSVDGAPFCDPAADTALIQAITSTVDHRVRCREYDADVNDATFARAMADELDTSYRTWRQKVSTRTDDTLDETPQTEKEPPGR